ncbi:alkaline phytoceramidase family protein [Gorgonomyces haynaldii]|nr:alkaline phytoceramidase family protein [Gorgonomyces haynaldii]
MPPFWGDITSSVDWCEPNYIVSPYIAEFYNTVSSLAIVIVGLLGILFHPWADSAFQISFLTTSMVGIGSTLFHMTLLKEHQAMDEVPMLWAAMTYVYIGITQNYQLSVLSKRLLGGSLMLHAIVTTLLVTLTNGSMQFKLFHISFASAEIYGLIQVGFVLYRKRAQPNLLSLGILGFSSYLMGVMCWFTDFSLCEQMTGPWNPQLHGWWHVLVSLGLYCLTLILLANESGTSVAYRYGIPRIHLKTKL